MTFKLSEVLQMPPEELDVKKLFEPSHDDDVSRWLRYSEECWENHQRPDDFEKWKTKFYGNKE